MAIPQLQQAFVVRGNGPEKALLSMVELQVKQILMNPDYLAMFKLTATAQQIVSMGDSAVGIYRLPERLMYGSGEFNNETGAPKQNQGVKTAKIILDHEISIKYQIRKFDMNRFLSSGPDVRTSLSAEWAGSVTINYMLNMELYFLTGVQDYLISRYASGDKDAVLISDLASIETADDADKAFYKIAKHMNKKISTITLTEIGTKKSDWHGLVGLDPMTNLTRAFTKLVGTDIAAKSLTRGTLYEDSILGTSISEHMFLGKKFDKGLDADGNIVETGINRTREFDLSTTQALFLHMNNIAMPSNFEEFLSVMDNDTGEPKFMGRAFFALPESLRGELGFLVMAKEPTAEQIATAKDHYFDTTLSSSNSNINYKSYQVADYDTKVLAYLNGGDVKKQLSSVITTTELGELADKTEPTIKAGIVAKNSTAKDTMYSLSAITDTGATATGKGDYEGVVPLTFTIKETKTKTKSEIETEEGSSK